MSQYLVTRIYDAETIHVSLNSEVAEVHGTSRLEAITVNCDGNLIKKSTSALFIFIGASPSTEWLDGTVKRDAKGFVYTGPDVMENGKPPANWPLERDPFLLETNVPGIFASGDVRHGSVKRVASAVGEGSIAVQFIHQYLADIGA